MNPAAANDAAPPPPAAAAPPIVEHELELKFTVPAAQRAAVLAALRAAGAAVLLQPGGADGRGSLKAQFRRADASGARFALVFGTDELGRGEVAVKPLRDATAAQYARPLAAAAQWAHELRNA